MNINNLSTKTQHNSACDVDSNLLFVELLSIQNENKVITAVAIRPHDDIVLDLR